jgi:decaprenyl-phosphate phosphoribosyltransferase
VEYVSSTTRTPRGPLRALISAIRPGQWVKNGLLIVAPAAAGQLGRHDVQRHTAVAIASFCLVASALYLLNDLRDIEADRAHPTKRYRAIAAGELRPSAAVAVALCFLAVGFSLPLALWHYGGLEFILGLYVAVTLSYIVWFKNVAVLELGLLASGFILRAYAGAVANHIFVSSWFLVVISFGALYLAVGKRSSELKRVGTGATRASLSGYSGEFLASALTMSAAVTVTGYCLWAFDTSSTGLSSIHHHVVPIRLSVAPVVLAILFIMRSAEAGDGAAPEELLLKNRTVQALVVVWAALLAVGIYR